MLSMKKKVLWGVGGVGVVIAVAVFVGVATMAARHHADLKRPQPPPDHSATPVVANTPEDGGEAEPGTVTVNTVSPRRDSAFSFNVEEPAYVTSYYRADLEAVHVSGPVKFISVAAGDPVKQGQRLVEIDVPDLVQQVAEKQAVVDQRQTELKLAQANLKVAQVNIEAAESTVKEKEALLESAEAERVFRQKELNRFQGMLADKAVTRDIVDEREKFYQAAEATVAGAHATVARARADLEEVRAKWEAAGVDVQLKQALLKVAEADRDQAQTLRDFAVVRAPFDGVVRRRSVDPGSFVQNASTGNPKPLLSVERTDIVTVFMKVPDNYAPYVTKATEAIIEMPGMGGRLIHAKVSRCSPSLDETDRTRRVEVDLYNGNQKEYQAFLTQEKATGNADLKGGVLPLFPRITTKSGRVQQSEVQLLPGMFGKMQLVLEKLRNAYLLPSQAIVSQGGQSYIYEVKDGIAHLRPVEVQVDDGKVAKVAVLERVGDEEVKRTLTGLEEIVSTNQGELRDGQPVKAVQVSW